MLKIGQEVYIRHEPYDGEEHFDFDGDDYARISGLVAYGGEVLYQLDRYADHCLWCEDDLDTIGEEHITDEPLFDIYDEVIVKGESTVRKISVIYKGGAYCYLFEDQGYKAHIGIPGVVESDLTLYRKSGQMIDYTLF